MAFFCFIKKWQPFDCHFHDSMVGMTRLERATTRPPDVYSTN
jgi:hypothetical protein